MQLAKKYLDKREQAIGLLLKKNKNEYTPATFHDLRVELKKLNAFFDLLNFCAKDFKRKKTAKLFKLVFHQAGKVRELQLEQAMLGKYFGAGRLSNYKSIVREACLKEEAVFFEIIRKKSFISNMKKAFRKARAFVKEITKKGLHNYLDGERKEIIKLLNHKSLQVVQLHRVRKHLKRFDYIRKRLETAQQSKLPAKNALSDLLGKWHDQQVMISSLQKAISGGQLKPREINQLRKAETKLSSARNLFLKKIKKTILSSEFILAAAKKRY